MQYLGWPGFGDTPANEHVTCLGHLAALAIAELNRPWPWSRNLREGVVAAHIVLERPDMVTHLVLIVTSGGLNLPALGAEDWRAAFGSDNPILPR